jgi:hypothetical protein
MAMTTDTDAAVAAIDELVSGLFDIGDDINAAVVWLAEHWSGDLPAPRWAGRLTDQHRPGRSVLRLQVRCSPPELARIASLAGASPVVERTGPGNRWHVVCSLAFGTGRVELRAATSADPQRIARYLASYLGKTTETDR